MAVPLFVANWKMNKNAEEVRSFLSVFPPKVKDLVPSKAAVVIAPQAIHLREQSYKLRALLIQELTAKNYNLDEVNAIKDRLKMVADQRLQLIYTAVDKASTILGHDQAYQSAKIIRTFDFEGHGEQE